MTISDGYDMGLWKYGAWTAEREDGYADRWRVRHRPSSRDFLLRLTEINDLGRMLTALVSAGYDEKFAKETATPPLDTAALQRSLSIAMETLNIHEKDIVLMEAVAIAMALLKGHQVYGPFDPKADGRFFELEAEEEAVDGRVYRWMRLLKEEAQDNAEE